MRKSPPALSSLSGARYLLFDGTYFHHSGCLICLLDAHTNAVVSVVCANRENYHTTKDVLIRLKKEYRISPVAITLDGNTTALRAVRRVWPRCLIQRCLVHIQRQGLSWLRRFPKSDAARELRLLLLTVTTIHNQEEKQRFVGRFNQWLEQYGSAVDHLSANDKVGSDLQRAKSLLIHALPDMFHYLSDWHIPFSTNALEGFFSQAKECYRKHRGIRTQNREQFFRWYAYFKVQL